MNLIKLSSEWLQKTDYSKSIQVRTKDVIYRFLKFVQTLPDSSFNSITGGKTVVIETIQGIYSSIESLLNGYLDGNLSEAIEIARGLMTNIPLSQLTECQLFYRARGNDTGFLYKKEEMFHIPYELRHKIKNQRYSVSGLPCLYLGSSTYLCWEELERPEFQKCNFCLLESDRALYVFDLRIPSEFKDLADVYRICLALACSLKTQRDHEFKLEYIVPQCLLYAITTTPCYAHDGVGICYYSVRFLYQESSAFILDFDLDELVSRFINVVIPAQSPRKKGQSELLKRMFLQTPSMSLMYRYLLNSAVPKKYVNTVDGYGNSQFGLLEDYLRYSLEVIKKANSDNSI